MSPAYWFVYSHLSLFFSSWKLVALAFSTPIDCEIDLSG